MAWSLWGHQNYQFHPTYDKVWTGKCQLQGILARLQNRSLTLICLPGNWKTSCGSVLRFVGFGRHDFLRFGCWSKNPLCSVLVDVYPISPSAVKFSVTRSMLHAIYIIRRTSNDACGVETYKSRTLRMTINYLKEAFQPLFIYLNAVWRYTQEYFSFTTATSIRVAETGT